MNMFGNQDTSKRNPKFVLRKEQSEYTVMKNLGLLDSEIKKLDGDQSNFILLSLKDLLFVKVKRTVEKYSTNDLFLRMNSDVVTNLVEPYVRNYIMSGMKNRESYCTVLHHLIGNTYFNQSELKSEVVNNFIEEVCVKCTDVYKN